MIRLVGSIVAIPASRARLCTHFMEMGTHRKGAFAMSETNELFLSVGIDVGADISWMPIALPNQIFVGKPFKITHSNLSSLEGCIRTIKEAEEMYSLESRIFLESTGIYHYPLFCYTPPSKHFPKNSCKIKQDSVLLEGATIYLKGDKYYAR